jgi:hypothetical protein
MVLPPPLVIPPSHLPYPAALLQFDIDEKKNEIFEAAREQIRNKAQYSVLSLFWHAFCEIFTSP